ncbi:MAG: hypothetical protein OHK0013_36830 [Sandaracinaceae bacterium]
MRDARTSWGRARGPSLPAVLASLVAACAPTPVPAYDPCTPGQSCREPRNTCVEIAFTTAEAAMCTLQRCVGDVDCPLDARGARGACLLFDGALPTCFERCTRLADCATGWSCEEVTPVMGVSERVCVPVP